MNTSCTITNPYKNRLERDYADLLEIRRRAGEIQWWSYEAVRFRIGAGALYTPDFLVLDKDGQLHVHETKGRWMEAAKVRIKAAADIYPFLRFVGVRRVRGGWEYEGFGCGGEE